MPDSCGTALAHVFQGKASLTEWGISLAAAVPLIAPLATAVAGLAFAFKGLRRHQPRRRCYCGVLVGAVLLLSSPLRLGWIADLLSIPLTTGFLAGISVHIIRSIARDPRHRHADRPSNRPAG